YNASYRLHEISATNAHISPTTSSVRAPMEPIYFINLLISALMLAGVYAAMSVGMTIIYGVMKIVNLAHAGFLMLGAYFVYELHERMGLDPLLGVVLAFPAFFFLGAAIHWL